MRRDRPAEAIRRADNRRKENAYDRSAPLSQPCDRPLHPGDLRSRVKEGDSRRLACGGNHFLQHALHCQPRFFGSPARFFVNPISLLTAATTAAGALPPARRGAPPEPKRRRSPSPAARRFWPSLRRKTAALVDRRRGPVIPAYRTLRGPVKRGATGAQWSTVQL